MTMDDQFGNRMYDQELIRKSKLLKDWAYIQEYKRIQEKDRHNMIHRTISIEISDDMIKFRENNNIETQISDSELISEVTSESDTSLFSRRSEILSALNVDDFSTENAAEIELELAPIVNKKSILSANEYPTLKRPMPTISSTSLKRKFQYIIEPDESEEFESSFTMESVREDITECGDAKEQMVYVNESTPFLIEGLPAWDKVIMYANSVLEKNKYGACRSETVNTMLFVLLTTDALFANIAKRL